MPRAIALAFDSDLPYEQIFQTLNAMGPWEWTDRDCAWYGNLASARVQTPIGSIRLALIESGPNGIGGYIDAGGGRRYAISAVFESAHPDAEREWESISTTITGKILPALQARNLCATDVIDD